MSKIPISVASSSASASSFKFGVLNLEAISAPITSQELNIIFMIDCSGSMSDFCSDERTKMQHIIHTLQNMILFFKEHATDLCAYITIYSFDECVYDILDKTRVTEDNYAAIIKSIHKITPKSTTNIESALRTVAQVATTAAAAAQNMHLIFMTDGEATAGNTNSAELRALVNTTVVKNTFIGFGINHDPTLLAVLGSGKNSSNYFVDKLEKAGLVYGEILHNIIYTFLKNTVLHVDHGVVYDFKTNSWSDSLYIDEVVGETNKYYYVASTDVAQCRVRVTATSDIPNENAAVEFTIVPADAATTPFDFTRHIYRQRTLQLLYAAREFSKKKKHGEDDTNHNLALFRINNCILEEEEEDDPYGVQQASLKQDLHIFIEEMKVYMTENNLSDDKFYKNMCDDIYIAYMTFDTNYGQMYVSARQVSQGTQRCYNVTDIHSHPRQPPRRPRGHRGLQRTAPPPRLQRSYGDSHYPLEQQLQHNVSDFVDTPYSTPRATQVMREISTVDIHWDPPITEESVVVEL